MPLTFPAHQAVVLPIKLLWPIVFNVTLGAVIGVLVAGCSTRA